MAKETYTNEDLARDYVRIVSQERGVTPFHSTQRRGISEYGPSISELYSKEGSLDKLNISGVGANAKKVLELLLEHGLTETSRIFCERESEEHLKKNLNRLKFRPPRLGNPDPSIEDGVRRLEDG